MEKIKNWIRHNRFPTLLIGIVSLIIIIVLVGLLFRLYTTTQNREQSANTKNSILQDMNPSSTQNGYINRIYDENIDEREVIVEVLQAASNGDLDIDTSEWSMVLKLAREYAFSENEEEQVNQESARIGELYREVITPTEELNFEGVEYHSLSSDINTKNIFLEYLMQGVDTYAQEGCEDDYADLGRCYDSVRYPQFDIEHEIHVHNTIPNPELYRRLIPEGVLDGFEHYQGLGHEPMPLFFIVVDTPVEGRGDIMMDAEYQRINGRMTCRVNIWGPAVDEVSADPERFKFNIAHELYHCIQYRDFNQQMFPINSNKFWWVEGTAEAMADQVYPSANYEYLRNDGFDSRSNTVPFTQIHYPNYAMFQYILNQKGYPWLRSFLQNLPTGRVDESQFQQYMINSDGFFPLYHEFSQKYISSELIDTSGEVNPIPVGNFLEKYIIDETPVTIQGAPFLVNKYKIGITPIEGVLGLELVEQDLPQSDFKTRDLIDGVGWTEQFPSEVGYRSCNDDPWREGKMVLSFFDTDQTALYDVTINPTQLEVFVDMIDPESLTEDTDLYGNWLIDTDSEQESKEELFSALESGFDIISEGLVQANNEVVYYESELCFYPRNIMLSQTKYQYRQTYVSDFGNVEVVTTGLEKFVSRYDIQNDSIVFLNPSFSIEGGTTTTTPFGTQTTPLERDPIEDQIFSPYEIKNNELILRVPIAPYLELKAQMID